MHQFYYIKQQIKTLPNPHAGRAYSIRDITRATKTIYIVGRQSFAT